MMSSSIWILIAFFTATSAVLLAGILVFNHREGGGLFSVFPVLAVVAFNHTVHVVSYVLPIHSLIMKKLLLLGEVLLPVALGYAGLSLVQKYSSNPEYLGRTWWDIMTMGAVILGILFMGFPEAFTQLSADGQLIFQFPDGVTIWAFILIASALSLRRLEQILRSFRDPLLYRLKYILIGLGGLACISLAQAIHMLWVPVWRQDFVWAAEIASLSSLLLIGIGLKRWRGQPFIQKFQMSHHAIYTSLIVLCVAGYVVIVGLVAIVIQRTGWQFKESLAVLTVFFALLGLVLTLLSRRTRISFHNIIARHFFRTKYDYREKWLEITETFIACDNLQQIWDRYLEWLGQTFGASQVTIWKYLTVDGRYHQIRKDRRQKTWVEREGVVRLQEPLPLSATHPVVIQMKEEQGPVLVSENQNMWDEWKEFIQLTHAHVCVPLLTRDGRLVGFCTLSKTTHDKHYDQEDCDLLRAIAHHVTMLLIQFDLVEERSSAAKWEAVHRFSAFYLHDLKNLASSLSMVAQNAEEYASNQEFQASAMRTVRNTSRRIMNLMEELAAQSKQPNSHKGSAARVVNLNMIIQDTVAAVSGQGCRPAFHPGQEVPMLGLKVEAMKQVLLNLILNAQQAIGDQGTINISTACDGEQVIIEIVDTGRGMSAGQLENLFQPFQSSKKHGLGVGLYQCKRIIEDHQGNIHIESQEGHGTTVIITLPVKNADNSSTGGSGITKADIGNVSRNPGNHET